MPMLVMLPPARHFVGRAALGHASPATARRRSDPKYRRGAPV